MTTNNNNAATKKQKQEQKLSRAIQTNMANTNRK